MGFVSVGLSLEVRALGLRLYFAGLWLASAGLWLAVRISGSHWVIDVNSLLLRVAVAEVFHFIQSDVA